MTPERLKEASISLARDDMRHRTADEIVFMVYGRELLACVEHLSSEIAERAETESSLTNIVNEVSSERDSLRKQLEEAMAERGAALSRFNNRNDRARNAEKEVVELRYALSKTEAERDRYREALEAEHAFNAYGFAQSETGSDVWSGYLLGDETAKALRAKANELRLAALSPPTHGGEDETTPQTTKEEPKG